MKDRKAELIKLRDTIPEVEIMWAFTASDSPRAALRKEVSPFAGGFFYSKLFNVPAALDKRLKPRNLAQTRLLEFGALPLTPAFPLACKQLLFTCFYGNSARQKSW